MKGTEAQPTGPDVAAGEVTDMLRRWRGGDSEAYSSLITLLYPDLRKLAEYRMRRERAGHTLQPTALVSEFFLQLVNRPDFEWKNRAHFLAVASQAMRRILVDYARAQGAIKRGGDVLKLQIADLNVGSGSGTLEMLVFNELLERLQAEEPRMAKVVEMHCFGGLTFSEIAEVIGVDERTAKRDWQVARAWLLGHLKRGGGDCGGMGTH